MSVERVLIAAKDYTVLDSVGTQFAAHGYDVCLAATARELSGAARTGCDVALIDLGLPGGNGLEAARQFSTAHPETAITVMGAPAEIAACSEECLALHYGCLQTPLAPTQALLAVAHAAELKRLREENHVLRLQWEEDECPDDFVSRSPAMIDVLRQAATAADTDEPVVIYGAPGTEKEVLALYIHKCSARANNRFVRFECGRSVATTEAADLFGREYHGPNGAVWRRRGRVELASGGTLLMDNITELSPSCQARLLRFVEEGRFGRSEADHLGRTVRRPDLRAANCADVRIICASAHEFDAARAGGLREDLLFRLSTLSITIPPLAQRRQDILPLAERFVRRFAHETSKDVPAISREATRLLENYDWPGNVAELRDTIRAAVTGSERSVLEPEDLLTGPSRRVVSGVIDGVTGPSLEDAERQFILRTLGETHGNKARAARRLCITTTTLANKLSKYRTRRPGNRRTAPVPELDQC